jgi:hypothetical protein
VAGLPARLLPNYVWGVAGLTGSLPNDGRDLTPAPGLRLHQIHTLRAMVSLAKA